MQLGIRLHDTKKLPFEERIANVHELGFVCGHLAPGKVISEFPTTDEADNYLPKPVQTEKALGVIRGLLGRGRKRTMEQNFYICKSPPAVRLQEMVRLVAPADGLSVLIRGASGTGKERVARQIHAFSKRSAAPFVAVDCGALPRELAASELFGHKKGSVSPNPQRWLS